MEPVTLKTLLCKNLPVFIAALKEANIEFVTYSYDGGHDNGCIEAPKYYRKAPPDDTLQGRLERSRGIEIMHGGESYCGMDRAEPPTKTLPWLQRTQRFCPERNHWANFTDVIDAPFEKAAEDMGDVAAEHLLSMHWWDGDHSSSGDILLNVGEGTLALRGTTSTSREDEEMFDLSDEDYEEEEGEVAL